MMFPLLAAALLAAPPDRPAVLIFGTGWGAEGTQASIEAHALALAAAVPPDQLLIGGGSQLRSIQADGPYDELADLLGLVLDRRDGLHVEYRRPRGNDVGAATKEGLLAALDRLIALGRPVVVWGAGHGSGASEDQPASLELWGPEDQLDVTTLAQHLDQAAPKAHLAFVLGQCHSGAFADLMYIGGDPKRGLATPTRCVLAAVPFDREAAGCTSDLGHPDARAYLAVFAEALSNKTTDSNGDGQLGLDEAHGYASLHDSTIDLPVTSSQVWLARQRRLPELANLSAKDLAGARPFEQRLLLGLAPEGLKAPAQIARALAELRAEEERLDTAHQDAQHEEAMVRRRVSDRLLAEWPELTNPFHPKARALLSAQADTLKARILGDPELEALKAKAEASAAAEDAALAVGRRRARLERYEATARHVAARARLSRGQRANLERLYGCESTGL